MTDPERESPPWKDEIVEEVRSARAELLAACDFDLDKLAEHLRQEQERTGRVVVTFPRRMPRKKPAM